MTNIDNGEIVDSVGEFNLSMSGDVATINGNVSTPAITYLSDGGYVVAWEEVNGASYNGYEYNNETESGQWLTRENHDIFIQRFDANGEKVDTSTKVNEYDARDQHDVQITSLTEGRYLVTWTSDDEKISVDNYDNGSRYIKGRVFDANNNPVDEEFTVARAEYDPIIGLPDGGFIVTWSADARNNNTDGGASDNPIHSDVHDGDEFGVFGQRFDASGQEVGGRFQINTFTQEDQIDSDITVNKDGDIIVTWQSENQDGDDYGIYMQKFELTSEGVSKVGSEKQINSVTAGAQKDPEITALADGNSVITWEHGTDISAQIINANGDKVGSEIVVVSTAHTELNPVITALSSGFVISWQSNVSGNNNIFAQRFDASGNTIGTETQVNTTALGEQIEPVITTLTDGGYMIAWQNTNQDITTQRFNEDGTVYKKTFVLDLSNESDSGVSSTDNITTDKTPTFEGVGEVGASVTIYNGDVIVGTSTVDANGKWSITTSELSDGDHSLRGVITDLAGNSKEDTLDVKIDTQKSITIMDELIDLTEVSNNMKDIDVIDLNNNINQRVEIDLADIVDLTDEDNDLVFVGENGDVIDFKDNNEWHRNGEDTKKVDGVEGDFKEYVSNTNPSISIFIEDDIEVDLDF